MWVGTKAFFQRHPLACFLFFALVLLLLAWHPLFNNQFVMWDDDFNIYENPIIRSGNWLEFWKTSYMGFYIPVTYTVWAGVAAVFGQTDPTAFQVLNLSFHLLNTILVFLWLRVLAQRFIPQVASEKPWPSDALLFLVSLIYLLHPMQVGAVAWHSGFRDILSTTGTLAALLFLFSRPGLGSLLLASLAFAFALLSKPASVYLPGMTLMLAFALQNPSERRRIIQWSLVHLGFAGLFIFVTRRIQSHYMIGLDAAPWLDRPFVILDSYGFYVRQFFLGSPLSADYGRTPSRLMEWGLWTETLPWLIGFLLIVALIFYSHRRAGWAFLALWLVSLSPTSGLVHFNFQRISTVADHYIQPALPAFLFLVVFGFYRLRQLDRGRQWVRPQQVSVALLVLALMWSAVQTHARIGVWRESEVLFHSMLKVNRFSHSANNYLGFFAYRRKDWPAAQIYFRDALASQPLSGIAAGNLAYSLIRQGQYLPAHNVLKDFLKDPEYFRVNEVHRHVIAMNFLANSLALANLGRYPEAFEHACRVFEFNPEQRDLNDARETLRKLQVQLNPQNPDAVVCPAKSSP